MSFTEDELQSFNTILERRLAAQRQEMEHALEQRFSLLTRDIEQRFVALQQELTRLITHKLNDQQNEFNLSISQKLGTQQSRIIQGVGHEFEQRQKQQQEQIQGLLAARFQEIERLLSEQRALPSAAAEQGRSGEQEREEQQELQPLDVQTDLSWEELMEVIGKSLDERLMYLREALQAMLKSMEQRLSVQFHMAGQVAPYRDGLNSMSEVFESIDRLEHIIESMQVAMTSNHALLSNRLYHHQQMPLERAHPPAGSRRRAPDMLQNTQVTLSEESGDHEQEMT